MPSIVDIVNRALDKLGQNPVVNLVTDGTTSANLANRTWPIVRDQMLREHPWNFAIKRTNLAPLSDAPDWGYNYQHELPSDFLRLVEIRDVDTDEYQLEGGKILTDESILYIRYVAIIEDPNEYDSAFIDALASRLAFEMCERLTQSNTKKELFWEEHLGMLSKAKSIGAIENPSSVFEEDEWIEVRY